MPAKKPQQPVSAEAFLNMARDYADAANELFMVADARPKTRGHMPPLSSPLYFLYSHAAESAFKAFLTANGIPIGEIAQRLRHNLPKLYERSRNLGLVIGGSDRLQIGNVVSLLHSENEDNGFRYYNLGTPPASGPPGSMPSVAIPDLSWVREVTGELLKAVEPHISGNAAPGGVVKFTFIVSKPEQKTQTKSSGA
jgi:hypothetical protein